MRWAREAEGEKGEGESATYCQCRGTTPATGSRRVCRNLWEKSKNIAERNRHVLEAFCRRGTYGQTGARIEQREDATEPQHQARPD